METRNHLKNGATMKNQMSINIKFIKMNRACSTKDTTELASSTKLNLHEQNQHASSIRPIKNNFVRMKKYLFSFLLFSLATAGFCTTWTITNSAFTFTPATTTITVGDDVIFILEVAHNAVEVSQSTWNANGNTALAGGFLTSFGGGSVQTSQLAIGTHYYVCHPHASIGMKGVIIVQSATGIEENQLHPDFSVYPNPSNNLMTIKANNSLIGLQYSITDQTGRQVFNGKLVNETTLVDIGQLTSGIYLIQIGGQRRQSFKVIKN